MVAGHSGQTNPHVSHDSMVSRALSQQPSATAHRAARVRAGPGSPWPCCIRTAGRSETGPSRAARPGTPLARTLTCTYMSPAQDYTYSTPGDASWSTCQDCAAVSGFPMRSIMQGSELYWIRTPAFCLPGELTDITPGLAEPQGGGGWVRAELAFRWLVVFATVP